MDEMNLRSWKLLHLTALLVIRTSTSHADVFNPGQENCLGVSGATRCSVFNLRSEDQSSLNQVHDAAQLNAWTQNAIQHAEQAYANLVQLARSANPPLEEASRSCISDYASQSDQVRNQCLVRWANSLPAGPLKSAALATAYFTGISFTGHNYCAYYSRPSCVGQPLINPVGGAGAARVSEGLRHSFFRHPLSPAKGPGGSQASRVPRAVAPRTSSLLTVNRRPDLAVCDPTQVHAIDCSRYDAAADDSSRNRAMAVPELRGVSVACWNRFACQAHDTVQTASSLSRVVPQASMVAQLGERRQQLREESLARMASQLILMSAESGGCNLASKIQHFSGIMGRCQGVNANAIMGKLGSGTLASALSTQYQRVCESRSRPDYLRNQAREFLQAQCLRDFWHNYSTNLGFQSMDDYARNGSTSSANPRSIQDYLAGPYQRALRENIGQQRQQRECMAVLGDGHGGVDPQVLLMSRQPQGEMGPQAAQMFSSQARERFDCQKSQVNPRLADLQPGSLSQVLAGQRTPPRIEETPGYQAAQGLFDRACEASNAAPLSLGDLEAMAGSSLPLPVEAPLARAVSHLSECAEKTVGEDVFTGICNHAATSAASSGMVLAATSMNPGGAAIVGGVGALITTACIAPTAGRIAALAHRHDELEQLQRGAGSAMSCADLAGARIRQFGTAMSATGDLLILGARIGASAAELQAWRGYVANTATFRQMLTSMERVGARTGNFFSRIGEGNRDKIARLMGRLRGRVSTPEEMERVLERVANGAGPSCPL